MPEVFPFTAIQFTTGHDLSRFVAPPYDVLDAAAKAALLGPPKGDPRNIVAVDLPHTPATELGPPEAYAGAGRRLAGLLTDGTLKTAAKPAMFAYRQTFRSEPASRPVQRSGMACCLTLSPFGPREGGGVLPHEETFSGPKQDRMALMRATRAQLSPIFGLHADEHGRAGESLRRAMGRSKADHVATTPDGTLHEVWAVSGDAGIAEYQAALRGEDVFIADGHHRYTTALNYLAELEASGPVGPEHPTRRCMFVLVGMRDPGLLILPTHRVLGGMKDYTFEAFAAAVAEHLLITPVRGGVPSLGQEMVGVTVPPPPLPGNVLGFYDFATRRCFIGTLKKPRPLATRFPDKPRAWQELDVAIVQHLLVEQICQPRLNRGEPVQWAFPHSMMEIEEIGRGVGTGAGGGKIAAQLAVIVRPTPLEAVREVSRAGQLMPQKSTYFHPKLATGLFMHALD
jgi:uncharacterized protein (DUF1015 family)